MWGSYGHQKDKAGRNVVVDSQQLGSVKRWSENTLQIHLRPQFRKSFNLQVPMKSRRLKSIY